MASMRICARKGPGYLLDGEATTTALMKTNSQTEARCAEAGGGKRVQNRWQQQREGKYSGGAGAATGTRAYECGQPPPLVGGDGTGGLE